jgi:hypothetical protein
MGCVYVNLLRCCPLNLGGAIILPCKTVNKPLISHYGYYRRILMNIIFYIYYGPLSYLNYWTLYTIPQYRCCIGLLHLLLKRWRGEQIKPGQLEGPRQNPWMLNWMKTMIVIQNVLHHLWDNREVHEVNTESETRPAFQKWPPTYRTLTILSSIIWCLF